MSNDFRPTSAGEPILPRMGAAWYNNTLPRRNVDQKSKVGHRERRPTEGETIAKCDGNERRYYPVAIKGLFAPEDIEERYVSVSTSGIDQYNWCIPQEDTGDEGNARVVIGGLTRAWVTRISPTHKYVTFNPVRQRLETADEGKALLLDYVPTRPALIWISNYTFPKEHVRATSLTCIKATTTTGTAIRLDNGQQITWHNPFRHHAMPGVIFLELENNQWLLTDAVNKKAEYIVIQGGALLTWWNGENPTPCGYILKCELDCICIKSTDKVLYRYDKNNDEYQAIAVGPLLGSPEFKPVLLGSSSGGGGDGPRQEGCDRVYEQQVTAVWPCGNGVEEISVDQATTSVTVITGYDTVDNDLIFNTAIIEVCSAVTGEDIVIPGTICEDDYYAS